MRDAVLVVRLAGAHEAEVAVELLEMRLRADPDRTRTACCDRAIHQLAAEAGGGRGEFLVNPELGLRFPVRDGIPVFVEAQQITGINSRFRKIYDDWAPFYDLLRYPRDWREITARSPVRNDESVTGASFAPLEVAR